MALVLDAAVHGRRTPCRHALDRRLRIDDGELVPVRFHAELVARDHRDLGEQRPFRLPALRAAADVVVRACVLIATCTLFCEQLHHSVPPAKSAAAGFNPPSTCGCILTLLMPISPWPTEQKRVKRVEDARRSSCTRRPRNGNVLVFLLCAAASASPRRSSPAATRSSPGPKCRISRRACGMPRRASGAACAATSPPRFFRSCSIRRSRAVPWALPGDAATRCAIASDCASAEVATGARGSTGVPAASRASWRSRWAART